MADKGQKGTTNDNLSNDRSPIKFYKSGNSYRVHTNYFDLKKRKKKKSNNFYHITLYNGLQTLCFSQTAWRLFKRQCFTGREQKLLTFFNMLHCPLVLVQG